MIRFARTTFFGKNQTRQDLWKGQLKDPVEALDNTLNYLENQS